MKVCKYLACYCLHSILEQTISLHFVQRRSVLCCVLSVAHLGLGRNGDLCSQGTRRCTPFKTLDAAFSLSRVGEHKASGMEQMYEVRETKGKGIGCFAKTFIKKGTKIIEERPLMHLRGDPRQSIAAYESLTFHEKQLFMSLRQSEDGAACSSYSASTDSTHDSIQDILLTNSFSVFDGKASILTILISRVNHSCLPNAEQIYFAEEGVSALWAIKDIFVGEEITITYIDEYGGYEERKKRLEENWGFKCDCKACDITTTFGKASDCRRIVLQQNRKDILAYLKGRSNDHGKTLFRNGDTDALNAVMESLDLLHLEGLPSAETDLWVIFLRHGDAIWLTRRLD